MLKWFKGVQVEKLPPEVEAYRNSYDALVAEIRKREPIKSYNDLIPPENPAYPWQGKNWQMLCYYCTQPIFYVKKGDCEAGYRQRGPLNLGWRHENDEWGCKLEKVRIDIDLPRCHVCGTQDSKHGGFCSVGGHPPFKATTMSNKEDEVQRWFERERGKEMHNALFDLLQVYEGNPSFDIPGMSLNAAVRRVLKASPWGHSVK